MNDMSGEDVKALIGPILEERDRYAERCTHLEVALRDALRDTRRVLRIRAIDPETNTYEYDWTDQVKRWADLCLLDLTGMSPEAYA